MKPVTMSRQTARLAALNCQLLNQPGVLPAGKEGVAQTVEHLGYVQVDTISVIRRAHLHTLWTRCPESSPDDLYELQAVDRRVFEYWGHALSYLPMKDYRFCLPRMINFQDPAGKWERERLAKYGHLMAPALNQIRAEGALSSKDFKNLDRTPDGHPKPVRAALELLFWQGRLMISSRRSFQRVYDLTERVLPPEVDTSYPTPEELGHFLVRRALQAHGIAREKEIWDHLHGASRQAIKSAIEELVESREILPVALEGAGKIKYFACSSTLETLADQQSLTRQVHFLSPFDNLIIQRDRTKKLFDFDYTLECYVPAAKRRHGYFVLPVLWGDRLVGRFDPKTDRAQQTMRIRKLLFEPNVQIEDEFLNLFTSKLVEFAHFNECQQINIEQATPTAWKSKLNQMIKAVT